MREGLSRFTFHGRFGMKKRFRVTNMTPVNRSAISRTAARVALALALLAAAANLPDQWEFIQARLPIMRLWFDPHAQQRLQLGAVPYDLLRAADAALPRDASVLLVTSGRDIRHHE